MDRERADFERALGSLQKAFGRGVLPVQLPIGSEDDFTGSSTWCAGRPPSSTATATARARRPSPRRAPDAVEEWRGG